MIDSLPDQFVQGGSYVGLVVAAGLLFLVPLFLVQRRDLKRLHAWRLLEPARGDAAAPVGPAARAAAAGVGASASGPGTVQPAAVGPAPATETAPVPSEGAAPSPPVPAPVAPPVAPVASPRLSPAERVTLDRPAVERVTAERATVAPPTALERAWRSLREPRHPLLLVAGAFLVGVGIFLGSLQLLSEGDDAETPARGGVVPAEVRVTVLNATSVTGLADKVSDDVEANGFELAGIGDSERTSDTTRVLYEEGHRQEAKLVARDLGVDDVRPIDRASGEAAEGADVVVIAGEDRARL